MLQVHQFRQALTNKFEDGNLMAKMHNKQEYLLGNPIVIRA